MENALIGIAAAILVSEQHEHERLRATFEALGRVGEVADAMASAAQREKVGRTADDDRRDHDAGVIVGEASVMNRSYKVGRTQGMRAAHKVLRGDAPDPRADPAGYLAAVRARLTIKAD